jgi:hypothetical protein
VAKKHHESDDVEAGIGGKKASLNVPFSGRPSVLDSFKWAVAGELKLLELKCHGTPVRKRRR